METVPASVQNLVPSLTVGRIVSDTFSVLGKRFWLFLGITAIPNIVVAVIANWPMITVWQSTNQLAALAGLSGLHWSVYVGGFLSSLLSFIIQGAFGYAVFQIKVGQPVSLGDCFAKGFRRIVPLVLTAIVYALMFWVGLVLLVIPGIIVSCMLIVVMPVCMVEKLGVSASIKRSIALTEGSRGTIFGASIVMGLIIIGVSLLTSMPVAYVIMSGGFTTATITILVLLSFVQGFISSMLVDAMAAVVYFDLRTAKEGIVLESLARVFD